MRVEVYRNLHTDSLSVRNTAKGGRVFSHPAMAQVRDVTFAVQPAGRERVLKERKKNVHAFVRGEFVRETEPFDPTLGWREANYNPYVAGEFLDKETGQPVTTAEVAFVTTSGVFYR